MWMLQAELPRCVRETEFLTERTNQHKVKNASLAFQAPPNLCFGTNRFGKD